MNNLFKLQYNKNLLGKELTICGVPHLFSSFEWVIYPNNVVKQAAVAYQPNQSSNQAFTEVDGYPFDTDEVEIFTKFQVDQLVVTRADMFSKYEYAISYAIAAIVIGYSNSKINNILYLVNNAWYNEALLVSKEDYEANNH